MLMATIPKSDKTRARILEAATEEFSQMGLSGARVEAIAARSTNSKRMIYHYFGSKEKLYAAVLEHAYQMFRIREESLGLQDMPPADALSRLVEETFDYHESAPNFVRLVAIENIHYGEHIRRSSAITKANATAVPLVAGILERGYKEGVFQRKIHPIDLHYMISALCVFRVGHLHTFSAVVGHDLYEPELRARQRSMIVRAVLDTVGATSPS
nr:TetR/AcrR family transcriptional regulator [Novosphingobium terrae]